MRYTGSVRRFAQGTPSIPALYSVLPGLQIIEEAGMETIRRESERRTEWMIDFALDHGWKVNSPREVNQRGGSIINFASANAHVTLRGSAAVAHCAGKGGVLAMTRQLAAEGGPHGIRANTISPALVVTGATKPGAPARSTTSRHTQSAASSPHSCSRR